LFNYNQLMILFSRKYLLNLAMIDCKILSVNSIIIIKQLTNRVQNRTNRKKYIQNYISHEDCKKQNYSGFGLTRMSFSSSGLFGCKALFIIN